MAERSHRKKAAAGEIAELSTAASTMPPSSPDGVVLTVLTGKAKGASLRIPEERERPTTIGKARDNDLVIDDPTVSRRHLRVRRTERGLEVEDLSSTNGTFIGPARIASAMIEPGTVLRAGDVELLVGVELGNVIIPPSEREQFGLLTARSLPMRRIFGVLERIAKTNATVLLLGETGTGKDALARSIHAHSRRDGGPFEVVDCGAVTSTLIESELFGHERGAFTGAVASREGAFERAAGGTIFLDEIGELPIDLQPKLLRVLEAREVRRVGGAKPLAVDVRIVAATTRDLRREIVAGTFREDLYFRLAVVPVVVPPLRSRLEDVPPLVAHLLAAMGADLQVPPDVMAALRSYEWPGNVRELRNVVERGAHFAAASGARVLRLTDFPPSAVAYGDDDGLRVSLDDGATYRETRARFEAAFERKYVRALLERFDGNVAAAARGVKMDRNHLTDLAKKHGLDRKR